jgi:hypothetical protein
VVAIGPKVSSPFTAAHDDRAVGRLTVTWSEPGGPAGLWVFGVVVDVRDLGLRIEQDVRDARRPGAACLLTLDGPTERAVDLAVGVRRAWGTLRYRT